MRIRLARAEAEAAERGLALADARLALRALTAGPARDRAADLVTDPVHAAPVVPRAATPAQAVSGATRNGVDAPATGADMAAAGPGTGSLPSPTTTLTDVMAPESGQPDHGDARNVLPPDVVAARNLAARTGGYVPAGSMPVKKRRWWQSRS